MTLTPTQQVAQFLRTIATLEEKAAAAFGAVDPQYASVFAMLVTLHTKFADAYDPPPRPPGGVPNTVPPPSAPAFANDGQQITVPLSLPANG